MRMSWAPLMRMTSSRLSTRPSSTGCAPLGSAWKTVGSPETPDRVTTMPAYVPARTITVPPAGTALAACCSVRQGLARLPSSESLPVVATYHVVPGSGVGVGVGVGVAVGLGVGLVVGVG